MEQLDALTQNVQLLLERYQALQQENSALRHTNDMQREELLRTHSELTDMRHRYQRLLVARGLSDVPGARDEAKRRITTMITQIDSALEVLRR